MIETVCLVVGLIVIGAVLAWIIFRAITEFWNG